MPCASWGSSAELEQGSTVARISALSAAMPIRNIETETWRRKTEGLHYFARQRGNTAGLCLENCAPLPGE